MNNNTIVRIYVDSEDSYLHEFNTTYKPFSVGDTIRICKYPSTYKLLIEKCENFIICDYPEKTEIIYEYYTKKLQ